MNIFAKIASAALATVTIFSAATANAAIIGVTVDPSDNTIVGETEFRAALGGEAVRYFIPLDDARADGVYGVDESGDYGRSSDVGSGGPTLSMFMLFDGITDGQAYTLDILFEDLDLASANDPVGFFESLEVFSADGLTSLSGLITDIANPNVAGDADTQQLLSIFLGTLMGDSFVIRLDFKADFTGRGRNTAEFLIAEISEVPIPGALPLFIAGIAGFSFAARRKKQTV